MAPGPAGVGARCQGGRRPRPTSCQRRAPPRPQAPRSPAPPPPLGSAPAGSTPPRARGPANHVSASGFSSQDPPPHSHALFEAQPQPPRRSRPEQEVFTNHNLAFGSDSEAPPLLSSLGLRLRPEIGPAQNALSWQPRFLGASCPSGRANPVRWLRLFGLSKCLSACSARPLPFSCKPSENPIPSLPSPSYADCSQTSPWNLSAPKLVNPKGPRAAPSLQVGASRAPASCQRPPGGGEEVPSRCRSP